MLAFVGEALADLEAQSSPHHGAISPPECDMVAPLVPAYVLAEAVLRSSRKTVVELRVCFSLTGVPTRAAVGPGTDGAKIPPAGPEPGAGRS